MKRWFINAAVPPTYKALLFTVKLAFNPSSPDYSTLLKALIASF